MSGRSPHFFEGFGTNVVGSEDWSVREVVNLNDAGPGSLREAIEAPDPRIIVFRVGGTIELKSSLKIVNPFVWLDGSDAPGGGICLKNHPSNRRVPLDIKTHDVVVRHIRVRPGPSTEPSGTLDAVNMPNAYNVVLDHCSLSWATDENLNTWYNAHDITIQWCLIAEGLYNSTHEEGPHSMGALLGGTEGSNISFHHNLLAHNRGRSPRVVSGGPVDVVNNVIYNAGDHPSTMKGRAKANYVNNYYKPGPDSMRDYLLTGSGQAYIEGNVQPGETIRHDANIQVVPNRFDVPPVTTTSAEQAYLDVLAGVGATLPKRDAVDERIVADVILSNGKIIDHPDEVGGWPHLSEPETLIRVPRPVIFTIPAITSDNESVELKIEVVSPE